MRAALPGVIAVAMLLTACAKTEPEVPPVEPAAEALADALTTGDFSRVRTTGDAAGDAAEILEGMHGLHPEVTVADVQPYETSATVSLDTTWQFSSPWKYRTQATLQLIDNEWRVLWDPKIINSSLDAESRLERTSTDATRGNILGTDGYGLTVTGPAHFVGLNTGDPSIDVNASARQLAELMSVNPEEFTKEANERKGETVMLGTARGDALPPELAEMPGVVSDPVNLPVAPANGSTQALAGRLGTATPDEAMTSSGNVTPGSVVGRSGLERARDAHLRGQGSTQVYLVPRTQAVGHVDPDNNDLLADYPEAAGQDVQTTIDGNIQKAVDNVLTEFDRPTSVVAVRPGTGEILAVGDSEGPARANGDSLTEPFSPEAAGSPISALALIRKGVDMEAEVECKDEFNAEGRTIEESDLSQSASQTTLKQAMAYGCNTAAASQFGRVDGAAINDAAASLGVGVDHDLGVPTDFGDVEVGQSGGDVAEALAGRGGQLRVTPLGMASMAASIKSGHIIVPWTLGDAKPTPDGQPPLTPHESALLRELMEAGASGAASGISGADGALVGFDGERAWAVGYNEDVAFAVVTRTDTASSQMARTAASQITQAAQDDDGSSTSGETGSSGN